MPTRWSRGNSLILPHAWEWVVRNDYFNSIQAHAYYLMQVSPCVHFANAGSLSFSPLSWNLCKVYKKYGWLEPSGQLTTVGAPNPPPQISAQVRFF